MGDRAVMNQPGATVKRNKINIKLTQFPVVGDEPAAAKDGNYPQQATRSEGTHPTQAGGRVPHEPYREVIVLVVYFSSPTDPRADENEITMVVNAFRSYKYHVVRYQLPDQSPTHDFATRLRMLRERISGPTLLIIYYVGHGGLGPDESGSNRLCFVGNRLDIPDKTIYWKDIYPLILSFPCDVLTMVNCCHSGATALTETHIAAVGKVHRVNATFSKEVIAAAGFQTVHWPGQEFSFSPILAAVLAKHKATSDLDSSKFTNEVSFMLQGLYKPQQVSSTAPVSLTRKRKRSYGPPQATNPVRYELVQGTAGPIALRPLSRLALPYPMISIASFFTLPLPEFTQRILDLESRLIQDHYMMILARKGARHNHIR